MEIINSELSKLTIVDLINLEKYIEEQILAKRRGRLGWKWVKEDLDSASYGVLREIQSRVKVIARSTESHYDHLFKNAEINDVNRINP